MIDEVQMIMKENDYLSSQNANMRGYWQDLADYCHPRKAWINSIKSKGERVKYNFVYSSLAIRSLRTMASGFHTNLTNPSSRWFALETSDKNLMEDVDVRLWFKQVEDIIYATLNKSNFYNIINEFYVDYGLFGTGGFYTNEDSVDLIRFTSIPIEQINLVEDANERFIGFYRNFKLTALQAYRLFGDNVGESVMKAYKDDKPFEEFDFLHYVSKRNERDVSKKDNRNMPFKSVWISKKDKHKIAESGYQEMPYIFGRFYKDCNDVFGYGPAMDCLSEVKLLNAQKKTVLRGGMKRVDPAMVSPSKGFVLPLNFNPSAINYYDSKTSADALRALDVGRGDTGLGVDMMELERRDIEEGFFVPLFRTLGDITKQMTIPEVQRRISEGMALLGPVVGRCTNEVLSPTVFRVLNILNRNMMLPPIPEALLLDEEKTVDLSLVYLSTLARAQRENEVASLQSFLVDIGQIASVKPAVLDKINEDKTADVLARIRGIDPQIMRSDNEVKAIREQAMQQQQAMMALQAGQSVADIDNTLAQSHKALKDSNN